MAPDFEYFVRLRPVSTLGHSLPGTLLVDLPAVLLGSLLFHRLLRQPLVAHLPSPFDRRLRQWSRREWSLDSTRDWSVFVSSALIGVASHILWDGFTHNHGFFVDRWQILSLAVPLGAPQVRVFKLLQHGSTLLGLSVVAFAAVAAARRQLPECAKPVVPIDRKLGYWAVVLGSAFGLAAVRLLVSRQASAPHLVGEAVVSAISGGLLGLAAVSWLSSRKEQRRGWRTSAHTIASALGERP